MCNYFVINLTLTQNLRILGLSQPKQDKTMKTFNNILEVILTEEIFEQNRDKIIPERIAHKTKDIVNVGEAEEIAGLAFIRSGMMQDWTDLGNGIISFRTPDYIGVEAALANLCLQFKARKTS